MRLLILVVMTFLWLSNSWAESKWKIEFDWSTHKRLAHGSDNFPVTWADDDNQYTTWGDGWGFKPSGSKVGLGISKIIGDKDNYYGKDIAYFRGKSYGILATGDSINVLVSPDYGTAEFGETTLYRTFNYGKSWVKSWGFSKSGWVITPSILQMGKNYSLNTDGYIYCYFTAYVCDAFKIQKPGKIFMFRLPASKIDDKSTIEYFTGIVNDKPTYSGDAAKKVPVMEDENGVGGDSSCSYNAGLKKYFLITEHTESFSGHIAIRISDVPYGPWEIIHYENSFGEGYIDQTAFYWNFSQKWGSDDGTDFMMVFTGVGSNDAMNTVRGRIVREKPGMNPVYQLLLK